MLEDILLIEERHRVIALQLATEVLKHRKPKFIIAISGESGSGKSELSHVLAKELFKAGIVAKTLHIDNFYKTLPLERNAYRKEGGVENVVGLKEYDWEKINAVVSDFKQGKRSTMPCVDLVTQRVDELTTDFSEIEILVMDGLYAIYTEGVDLAVYIELTYHETKKAQSGRGKEATDAFRFQVLEAEHQAVLSIREKAQWLVTKDYKLVVSAKRVP